MSVIAIVLLVAAVALLAATEWPRLTAGLGVDSRKARDRKRRKSHLRVVSSDLDESDEFARSVESDLARLPTIDERDARKH